MSRLPQSAEGTTVSSSDDGSQQSQRRGGERGHPAAAARLRPRQHHESGERCRGKQPGHDEFEQEAHRAGRCRDVVTGVDEGKEDCGSDHDRQQDRKRPRAAERESRPAAVGAQRLDEIPGLHLNSVQNAWR